MTYILGITGRIASGKSTVANMFKDLGAFKIDADSLVHELQQPGTEESKKIIQLLGSRVATEDGGINRKELGTVIAENPLALDMVEEILHPQVYTKAKLRSGLEVKHNTPLVILEVPLLFQSGMEELCDGVLVTTCDENERRARAFSREGMSSSLLDIFEKRQLSNEDLLGKADFIIETDQGLSHTRNEVAKLFGKLRELEKDKQPSEQSEAI